MARHVGIVGCSAEGAALCYRTLCTEGATLFGPHGHPEVSMHTHPLAAYVACLDRGDWAGVAELMLSSASKLASTGADLLICPDNTIHGALPLVLPHSPRPWLHIADEVVGQARERGFSRLGLLGTRWLVRSDVYRGKAAAAGLALVAPSEAEREDVNHIIMDELVYGDFEPDSTARLVRVIERMKSDGADAVILGCTELPLVLSDANSPLPVLDSTRLLARAALRQAAGT